MLGIISLSELCQFPSIKNSALHYCLKKCFFDKLQLPDATDSVRQLLYHLLFKIFPFPCVVPVNFRLAVGKGQR